MGDITDNLPGTVHRSRVVSLSSRFRIPLALTGVLILMIVGLRMESLGWLSTITTIFMFVMLAEAWNILGGYGGYLNLGMAAFFGLGAYTTAILFDRLGASPFLTALVGGLVAVLFGVVVGLPSLRLRGHYFAIFTLVIGFLVETFAYNSKLMRGAMGIFLKPLPFGARTTEQVFYFVNLTLMILTVLVVHKIEHSRFGYALVAIREDEDAAEILGVRTTWLKMVALLIGAMIAGVAGGIYAYRVSYIEPLGTFSLDMSIDVVLMTVVGGAGTWQGPLIGVPTVMLIAEVLRIGVTRIEFFGSNVPTEFNRLIFGVILVLIALYARGGVMGLIRGVRGRRFTV